ncbi:sigma-54-dependent transcriptional regulator [Saccharicrinis sp. FJH54]|uniref:sigma-54-dependent transcriptional regulator n=1 Tax=Saccharicrinis sp. FJH54 TaxID=3344665 RepID=UPI0035D4EF0D
MTPFKKANILIVDDNKSILSAIELLFKGRCNKVRTLSSPNMLLNELQNEAYDVLLLDMNFTAGINTGNEGIYWLQRVLELNPSVSVVMITAYGDVELAVKAIRMGATDFVLKPWENEKMLATVESAFRLSQSKNEINKLTRRQDQLVEELNNNHRELIGNSQAWLSILTLVGKVAATNANVLITGENGTGKELIAREIHRLSQRRNKIMVTVDMGSISETLFESELFGHKKGSFTDAHAERTGKIETAGEGTLFLDEIGNLPLAMQAKLLSVLQNRKVTKLGDNKPVDIDIRLICATNCNLTQMVNEGTFREDLLYRINTIQIELPPLRERLSDIPELAAFFLEKYARKYNKQGLRISSSAMDKLTRYSWPGNVRELQHAVERAVILCDQPEIGAGDFMFKSEELNRNVDYEGTLEDMEKRLIQRAIDAQNGNMTAVAGQLGITRQTLYNKIKRYGL